MQFDDTGESDEPLLNEVKKSDVMLLMSSVVWVSISSPSRVITDCGTTLAEPVNAHAAAAAVVRNKILIVTTVGGGGGPQIAKQDRERRQLLEKPGSLGLTDTD